MDQTFDVVVVGSGSAGLATALTAVEMGLTAVVLEKGARIGGTAAYSDGQIWAGANHLATEAGLDDSPEESRDYLTFLSQGIADPDLLDAYVENAPKAIRFFLDAGLRLLVKICPSVRPGAGRKARTDSRRAIGQRFDGCTGAPDRR